MKKVITYGSFDLFHEGHYNILKRAKALGDYLIVGITTEHFDESRGKLNIVNSIVERIDNVRNTGFADEIIIEDHAGQKLEDIQKYGIDIFTVGSDWVGTFDYLKSYCEVVYLERTKNISSTVIRQTRKPITRFGIVGTGRIARRFIPEAKFVSGVMVSCVYNPHIESAQKFAKSFELDSYYDDYEQFLDAVDAVYIASPHETHYEYAKAALLHGKHVLCEKPMVFQKKQAQELFAFATKNKLALMEGIKTAYCPGFNQLLGVAESGLIGQVKDVEACFTRITPKGVREMADTAFGGGFTEFASYSMLPIIKLMGTSYKEVRFDSIYADNGIDLYTKASFVFDKGFALSKSGVGVKSEGQLIIAGTKGYLLAESPWWLTKSFEVRYEDASKIEKFACSFLGYGLRYEISNFMKIINDYDNNVAKLTAEESIAMAGIMEQFLRQRSQRGKS